MVESSAPGIPSAPHVFSEARIVDAAAHVKVTSGNERKLYFELTAHDRESDEELLIGVGQELAIPFNVDVPLGTLVGHNPDARPIDRLTLWPAWRDGFYGIGWGGHWLTLDRVELRVPSTATGETEAVVLPLSADNVRVYPIDGDDPVDVEYIDTTEDERTRIWLHSTFQASRIEIDIPDDLLASAAPGPLGDGDGLVFESHVELRPGTFIPTASIPEDTTGGETESDSGGSDGSASGGTEGPGGGSTSATSSAGESGEEASSSGCGCRGRGTRGELWWVLVVAPFLRRSRRRRTQA